MCTSPPVRDGRHVAVAEGYPFLGNFSIETSRSERENRSMSEPDPCLEKSPTCPQCGARLSPSPVPAPEQLRQWFTEPIARRLGLYEIPPGLRISVVMPVYNEVASVEEILRRVREVPIAKEVIVVDDGSTDGTRDRLAALEGQPDLRIVYHPRNQGKGAALRTGFAHATGDIVLVQDADLEYDPIQYPLLIQPIVEGVADVVYGSRFAAGAPHRVLYFWHSVANRFLTMVSNAVTDLNLTDMETCYKVFRRDVIQQIAPTLKEKGFGIEVELTAKVARRRCRIFEIGISYFGRTYKEGKKIGLIDAFHALWCIVRYGLAD